MRKLYSALTAALLLYAVMLAAPAALADTDPDYSTDLLTTSLTAYETGGLQDLLALPPKEMVAGEKLLLTARLAGTSDALRMPRMAIRVDAFEGENRYRSTVASINHDGEAYGTQYVTTRWVFTAPTSGTYTIKALAEATSLLEQPDGSRPHISPVQDLTYLQADPVHPDSAEWRDATSYCVNEMAHTAPKIPACGTLTPTVTVLDRTFDVPAGATKATALAELELSREYGSFPGGNGNIATSLRVQPLTATGAACGTMTTAPQNIGITSNKHHYRLNAKVVGASLMAPSNLIGRAKGRGVDVDEPCAKVRVYTILTHISGNPVGLEGPNETAGYILWN